jgi:hypothetical protein
MARTKQPQDECAYCGDPATTVDHIPPKRLFTPPLPSNLVTVPACKKCNNGASNDDEIFRDEMAILCGSFRESAPAAERLQVSIRAIRRNKVRLRNFVLKSRRIDRYSPGGIFLGPGYAIPIDRAVHQRVNERIIRGLYRYHAGKRLGDGAISFIYIDKRKPTWREGLEALKPLHLKHVRIGDGKTFQYLYGWAADDQTYSIWLLHFFPGSAEQIIIARTG